MPFMAVEELEIPSNGAPMSFMAVGEPEQLLYLKKNLVFFLYGI